MKIHLQPLGAFVALLSVSDSSCPIVHAQHLPPKNYYLVYYLK